jgi:hypothetical protein
VAAPSENVRGVTGVVNPLLIKACATVPPSETAVWRAVPSVRGIGCSWGIAMVIRKAEASSGE